MNIRTNGLKFALASLVSTIGFTAGFSNVAHATVDAHDRIYIVARNIQSEEFFVERAPIIAATVSLVAPSSSLGLKSTKSHPTSAAAINALKTTSTT